MSRHFFVRIEIVSYWDRKEELDFLHDVICETPAGIAALVDRVFMEDWHFNIYVKTSVNQAMAVAIAKSLEQVIMGRQKMIRTFKDDAQPVGHNGIDIKIDGVKFLHELTANWPEQKDLLENINEPPNGVKH